MKKPINVGDRVLIEKVSGFNIIEELFIVDSVSLCQPLYSGRNSEGTSYFFSRRQVLKVWRKKPRKTEEEIIEELFTEWNSDSYISVLGVIRKALRMRPPKC